MIIRIRYRSDLTIICLRNVASYSNHALAIKPDKAYTVKLKLSLVYAGALSLSVAISASLGKDSQCSLGLSSVER